MLPELCCRRRHV